jgi:putative ATPase
MQCLPNNLRGRVYYRPTAEGVERRIRERMEEIKKRREQAPKSQDKKES